jgi:hypothetical protein
LKPDKVAGCKNRHDKIRPELTAELREAFHPG